MSTTDSTPATDNVEQKKTRVQMIDVLDIFVPPPRVRNYFTKKLSEVEKHFELKQLKKKDDSAQTVATTPAEDTNTDNTQEIRLSPEANAALAVVASSVLIDVIKHAMNNALAANMKRVTVTHFLSKKLETLDSQSLVAHLPLVKQKLAEMQVQATQSSAKKSKKAADTTDDTPQSTDATTDSESGDDDSKKEPEFVTYVARAFADVKAKDTLYASLMLTNDFKVFLSGVLVEFVQSVATLSMVFIEAMDLKTIKHRVVMKVVKSMLALHGRFDVFTSYKTTVDEKLALYEKYESKESTTAEQSQPTTA